jgi:hypothetical protein
VGEKQQSQQGVRNLTLSASQTSLSFARRGDGNLTLLSLSFNKERDVLAKAETG